ncbi:MAG: NUDIX domain-containing protein [Candidatus Diapherotrites archaeon]
MNSKKTKEKSVGAVIFRMKNNEKKYLLLHYGAGHWDFVKGHVEHDETEHETMIREVMEETGIKDAHLLKGFREEIKYEFRRKNDTIYKKVIFYILETETKEVVISHEHMDYKWLNYDDTMKLLTFENAKKILKLADDFTKK